MHTINCKELKGKIEIYLQDSRFIFLLFDYYTAFTSESFREAVAEGHHFAKIYYNNVPFDIERERALSKISNPR